MDGCGSNYPDHVHNGAFRAFDQGSMTGQIETAYAKGEAPAPPLYFGSNSRSGD